MKPQYTEINYAYRYGQLVWLLSGLQGGEYAAGEIKYIIRRRDEILSEVAAERKANEAYFAAPVEELV